MSVKDGFSPVVMMYAHRDEPHILVHIETHSEDDSSVRKGDSSYR